MVDRTAERGAFRSGSHVSLEICDRASLPISQRAHGTQFQSFAESGERSTMDLALRLGSLAIAADARSSEAQSPGLGSQQSESMHHAHTLSAATFGVGIFWVGVGSTGCQSIIGICFSLFKVQCDRTFLVRDFALETQVVIMKL